MNKVNLAKKLSQFSEFWSPKIIAELNDQHVKLAKIKGEFIWHKHEHEDELFLVIDGVLTIQLRNKEIVLKRGELFVVPRNTEHRTVAREETHILLFEPKTTMAMGTAVDPDFNN